FLDQQHGLLMIALRHGNLDAIQYRPAWLGQVVESRLRIQGDRIYAMAKAYEARKASQIADQVVAAIGGQAAGGRPDPVRQLAKAADLLRRPRRTSRRAADNGQLSLL
ncbi:MAG: hypothetical protein KIT22_18110, partial [Verrucomicrobiae bacterium]|nr:hypothetical protein [Verrucomicrobiae bacterium]